MQQANLELSPAAWFFVSESDADNETGNSIMIKSPFRVGRRSDLDLCLPCQSVSGQHAEIVEENGDLWLTDLNSTNGTFVNGRRLKSRYKLNENDAIQFGTIVFQISKANISVDANQIGAGNNNLDLEQDPDNRLERLFNGGVVPFYQPIVDLTQTDHPVIGYEVLGRSRLFGLKTPAQMFAAASRMELEAELSRVLRQQGITTADSNLDAAQKLFLNTHPAELECAGLEESLFELRENHPDRPLLLEVHESVLNDPDKFVGIRSTLENLDIKLVLHDVGGGNIHLASLAEVYPDVVKFDAKLLQNIDKTSTRRQKFVESLVKMIKDLGGKPMAHFIEQQSEHETILQMGFELGQGFHYGRPSAISDCEKSAEGTPQVQSSNDSDDGAADNEPKDAQWLLQQPKNHYTIQVLSAISEQRAFEHVQGQDNPGEYSIFGKKGKTRMLYIVCYGMFPDRAAAKEVAEKLADESMSPWIRMLSSIHAEIEGK